MLSRGDKENLTEMMVFEKRLEVGEGRVKVGQRGNKLSGIREQQVQRPRGRDMPGELWNSWWQGSGVQNLAGVEPEKRREAEDEM